jgi:hypothetical protein
MEQQQTGGSGTGDPSLTEEVQAQPETPGADGTETPALNRADRRAQAKGKKSGTGPNTNLGAGGARGPSKPTSGHVGQVRFPRTGHK